MRFWCKNMFIMKIAIFHVFVSNLIKFHHKSSFFRQNMRIWHFIVNLGWAHIIYFWVCIFAHFSILGWAMWDFGWAILPCARAQAHPWFVRAYVCACVCFVIGALSLSLSLSLCVCLCVCVFCASLFFCFCIFLFLFRCFSVSVFLKFCVSVFQCFCVSDLLNWVANRRQSQLWLSQLAFSTLKHALSLSFSLCVCVCVCLCVCVSVFLCFSVFLFLYFFVCVFLCFSVSVFLKFYVSVFQCFCVSELLNWVAIRRQSQIWLSQLAFSTLKHVYKLGFCVCISVFLCFCVSVFLCSLCVCMCVCVWVSLSLSAVVVVIVGVCVCVRVGERFRMAISAEDHIMILRTVESCKMLKTSGFLCLPHYESA